jgi:hypothetical protein
MSVEAMEDAFLRLPDESRAKLLARLLERFEESLTLEPRTAEAWAEEAARRDEEMDEGDAGVPAEEVFRDLRRPRG